MSTLKITASQWQKIRAELHKEYPRTVFMLRNKMKQVLGFTVREHKGWVENTSYQKEYAEWEQRQAHPMNKNQPWVDIDWEPIKGNTEFQIHLDFYNERKRTMFLLKFSEYLY